MIQWNFAQFSRIIIVGSSLKISCLFDEISAKYDWILILRLYITSIYYIMIYMRGWERIAFYCTKKEKKASSVAFYSFLHNKRLSFLSILREDSLLLHFLNKMLFPVKIASLLLWKIDWIWRIKGYWAGVAFY